MNFMLRINQWMQIIMCVLAIIILYRLFVLITPAYVSAADVVMNICEAPETTCIWTYNIGDVVTLEAEPEPGYYFAGWSGICTGKGDCTFTVEDNNRMELFARFELLPNKPRNLRRVK